MAVSRAEAIENILKKNSKLLQKLRDEINQLINQNYSGDEVIYRLNENTPKIIVEALKTEYERAGWKVMTTSRDHNYTAISFS